MLQSYIQNYLQKRSILNVGTSSVENETANLNSGGNGGTLALSSQVTLAHPSILKNIHGGDSTIHNIQGG
jgi:hypothetical protein